MDTRKKRNTLKYTFISVAIIFIFALYYLSTVAKCSSVDLVCRAKHDIRVLETALELYKLDNYQYPTHDQGLDALVNRPSGDNSTNWREGGYIKRLNKDPWGNDYRYVSPGLKSPFDVFSLGADGAFGGEGEAADIASWNLDS